MDKETKKKLLDYLQQISYAHEDGGFWKAWSEMHKYLYDLKTEEPTSKKVSVTIYADVELTDEEFESLDPPYDERKLGNPYSSMEAPAWIKEKINLKDATVVIDKENFYKEGPEEWM